MQGIQALRAAMLVAGAWTAAGQAGGQVTAGHAPAKMVQLSVVALDNRGQPVADLTAGDFQIADAGKPQQVAIFRHSDSTLRRTQPPGPGEFSNRSAANVPNATLILFDLLNETFGARGEAASYLVDGLKSLESSDTLYLYILTAEAGLYPVYALPEPGRDPSPSSGIPWTRNAKSLVEGAVARAFQLRPTYLDNIGVRVQATYRSLMSVANLLAGIPGRKNIVWITHGVPDSLPASATISGEPVDFTPLLRRLCQILDRVNVAIYPVMQVPPGMGGPDEAQFGGVGSQDTLQKFADLTGGPAKATNSIGAMVRQAMNDVRTSYQVAYVPPPENWDGKFHKLRVTCARKGVKIQVKTGYYAVPDQANDERDALDAAVAPAFDASEIGLRCTMAPSPKGGGSVRFSLRIDPADVRITRQGDRFTGHLGVETVGYLGAGEPVRSAVNALDVNASADEMAKARTDGIGWNQDITLGDAAEKVRFVVFDRESHAIGTVTIPLKQAK